MRFLTRSRPGRLARSLEPVYPLVFFDALRVKICDEGVVHKKTVHVAQSRSASALTEPRR
jgi:hypothetical protein